MKAGTVLDIKSIDKNKLIKKIGVSILGITIMAQGVSLFLMLGVGIDPISVFLDGLTQFGLSFGMAQTFLNLVMITLSLIFFRKYVGPSTVVALLFLGPLFDLLIHLEGPWIHPALPIPWKIIFMILAQLAFALGVSLYLSSELGGSPCDTPGVAISKMKNWDYGIVRVVVDGTYFVTGAFLGGTVGVGTICCVLLTGPLSQVFRPYCNRFVEKLCQ